MSRDILASIKKCELIFSNGQDVFVCGKHLWLFRTNGEFIKKVLPIRRPYKAVFLPNRRALVEGVEDHAYYYLDLETGEILWRSGKKGRRSGETNQFVVAPNGVEVYSLFYVFQEEKRVLCVERICPELQIHDVFPVLNSLNITSAIFCDKDGTLCALQYENVTPYNDDYYYNDYPNIFQHGILAIPFQNGIPRPYWKKQWQIQTTVRCSPAIACNGRYILHQDFSVLDLETQNTFFLLTDADRKSLPERSFEWFYDSERYLLTLWYTNILENNIVLDCKNKKIIGRYCHENTADNSASVGYGGCLIGNTFWMGTPNGVARLPFPNVR